MSAPERRNGLQSASGENPQATTPSAPVAERVTGTRSPMPAHAREETASESPSSAEPIPSHADVLASDVEGRSSTPSDASNVSASVEGDNSSTSSEIATNRAPEGITPDNTTHSDEGITREQSAAPEGEVQTDGALEPDGKANTPEAADATEPPDATQPSDATDAPESADTSEPAEAETDAEEDASEDDSPDSGGARKAASKPAGGARATAKKPAPRKPAGPSRAVGLGAARGAAPAPTPAAARSAASAPVSASAPAPASSAAARELSGFTKATGQSPLTRDDAFTASLQPEARMVGASPKPLGRSTSSTSTAALRAAQQAALAEEPTPAPVLTEQTLERPIRTGLSGRDPGAGLRLPPRSGEPRPTGNTLTATASPERSRQNTLSGLSERSLSRSASGSAHHTPGPGLSLPPRGAEQANGTVTVTAAPPSSTAASASHTATSERGRPGSTTGPNARAIPRQLSELTPGTVLGRRFELLELRGTGTLGTVWKAHDQKNGRLVALKLHHLREEDKDDRVERFLNSARVTSSLRHQHIVRVLETNLKDGNLLYFAMEYLGGGNIRQAMMGGKLSRDRIITAVLEACEALIYAHKQGVIHKNIKPSNLLLRPDGAFVLTDFDLAWMDEKVASSSAGAANDALYLAPEVLDKRRTIDHVSDVYSLGMTAMFLLNGVDLVQGAPTGATEQRKLEAQKEVLAKAVDVERGNRYPTLKDFRDALRDADGSKKSDKDSTEDKQADASREKTTPEERTRPEKRSDKTTHAASGAEAPSERSLSKEAPGRSTGKGMAHGPIRLVFPQEQKGEVRSTAVRGASGADAASDGASSDASPEGGPAGFEADAAASAPTRRGAPTRSWLQRNLSKLLVGSALVVLHLWALWYFLLNSAAPSRPDLPWTRIEGGSFTMGSKEAEDEEAKFSIKLSPFYITRSEITVAQYQACINAGQCSVPSASANGCNYGLPGRDAHPINCITHGQAKDFAAYAGGRLPSEAEWEFAARSRGLVQTFPWGADKPTCARAQFKEKETAGCDLNTTAPVCSKEKGNTAQGLCDMAGNVWEWVADWYDDDYYLSSPRQDPQGPLIGLRKVLRGGSYQDDAWGLRAANRYYSGPLQALPIVGFRVVADRSPTVGP